MTTLEPDKQWCDNKDCPDFAKVGVGNIRVHSYVEQRYGCRTCKRTFSATKGTFLYKLRTALPVILEVLAMLVERNSIRAISRVKHVRPNTILHWLDLAGQHSAEISEYLIHDLHLTQVQIDELWTFVKKNKTTSSPTMRRTWATPGSGKPSHPSAVSEW